jgi:ribosomal protein S18 acetylase RimI-like enzyme
VNRPEIVFRPAGQGDRAAVEDALVWAVNWSPDREPLARDVVLNHAAFVHYVAGWLAPGDLGVVAVAGAPDDGGPVGAAWLRCLPADDPGYGFVAEDVPELSVGVHPEHRGRGIGRRLLRALLAAARERGTARVSLSVERANRARDLYLGEGFRVVGGDGTSDTMLIEFPAGTEQSDAH